MWQRRNQRSRQANRRVRRHPAPSSILILECDASRLRRDGISLASDTRNLVRVVLPHAQADVVESTTRDQLLRDLAARAENKRRYEVVFVIGHGSLDRFALAHDATVSWSAVAEWIAPFRPGVVLVAACEGGRWLPARALFDGIRSLKEVYGSPALATQSQLAPLQLLALYLLAGKRMAPPALRRTQLAAFLLADAVIFRQTRREMKDRDTIAPAIWTGLEEAIRRALGR